MALKGQQRSCCHRQAIWAAFFACLTLPHLVMANMPSNIADLSIEELANIRVTSVSKKSESLATAPASIIVITGDEIRRSGAESLPEALRLAPNLQVARVDARSYAITARGFNSTTANKLLVLIDGRAVYTPLYSGVFWDAQDVMLEDVDRIEVIAGSGGTLWGANAVNGIINVITRTAVDTQGVLLTGGGNRDHSNGAMRYGGKLENGGHYRVYAKYADNDDTQRADGNFASSGWRRQQAGFRANWGDVTRADFNLQGDVYDGQTYQPANTNITISGANLLGRVNQKLTNGSDLQLQAYIDHTQREQRGAFAEKLTTIELEVQHALQFGTKHHVIWGGGYRFAADRIVNQQTFAFLPEKRNLHWANFFVRDEIAIQDKLHVTLGTKIENNSYTGNEFMPTVRVGWQPVAGHFVWARASRAVRTPSRIDRDFYVPQNPAFPISIDGGPNFESEIVKVLELGYRTQPNARLSGSVSVFYNDYDKLRTLDAATLPGSYVLANQAKAATHGLELSVSWQAAKFWRFTAGLVAQKINTRLLPNSTDISKVAGVNNTDPRSYWSLRSAWDISPGKEFDISLRHVGKLGQPSVPAYTSVDARLGWQVRPGLEFSLMGRNLLDSSHAEFGAPATRSEFQRNISLNFSWRM